MPVFVTPKIKKISSPARRMIVHTEAKKSAAWKVFLFYYWKRLIGILIGGVLIYFIFYYNRSPIQHIVFDQPTQEVMIYQDAFDDITNYLSGRSYYKQKHFHRNKLEETIGKKYPLIRNIYIASFSNGTLTLGLHYNNPDFIMNTENGLQRLVHKNKIIPYTSGTQLGGTGIHISITLPEDILLTYSGGVFRSSSSKHIATTIKKIDFIQGFSAINYYPGREKLSLQDGKNTFIIGLDPSKLETTFTERRKLLPYLPSEIPTKVDLSNPSHIIIQY